MKTKSVFSVVALSAFIFACGNSKDGASSAPVAPTAADIPALTSNGFKITKSFKNALSCNGSNHYLLMLEPNVSDTKIASVSINGKPLTKAIPGFEDAGVMFRTKAEFQDFANKFWQPFGCDKDSSKEALANLDIPSLSDNARFVLIYGHTFDFFFTSYSVSVSLTKDSKEVGSFSFEQ